MYFYFLFELATTILLFFLLNFMKFIFFICKEVNVWIILIGGPLKDRGFFNKEN